MGEECKFYAVGDVIIDREDPESLHALVRPVLAEADILFCQLEGSISDKKGQLMLGGWGPRQLTPKVIKGYKAAGFNVISFASNDALDWGYERFLDTFELLRKSGIQVVGGGENIAEARKPAIFECKRNRVGILTYCSIVFPEAEAGPNKAGIAPLRAWTHYERVDYEQPGTPPLIISRPYVEDLEAMVQDIKKLKLQVDVVAVSFHWGIHFAPKTIAMYQTEAAHAAIDAGADIILGHHPHILKGVEVYKGKVIFYSMNMFGFDVVNFPAPERFAGAMKLYGFKPDPDYPHYPFHPDAKMTILVKCIIADKEIKRVSFLPAWIHPSNQPEILVSGSKQFDEVVGYMGEITKDQELNAKLTVEGDEVVITA